MSLVTMNEMLPQARKEKRAVGAFNVANYETALAVMKAAEAEKSPVIIQVYDRLFQSDKAADIAGTLIRLAQRSNQPIALHLDHGASLEHVAVALHAKMPRRQSSPRIWLMPRAAPPKARSVMWPRATRPR